MAFADESAKRNFKRYFYQIDLRAEKTPLWLPSCPDLKLSFFYAWEIHIKIEQ
jgi:hypothetical protein